jgi:hypothetical protein
VAGFINIGLLYYTKKSANAAKSSAETARQTLHTTQRAYIDAKIPEVHMINDAKGKLFGVGVVLNWENSGLTRVPYMIQHTSFGQFPQPLPENFSFPDGCDVGKDCGNVESIVPPHGTSTGYQGFISAQNFKLMLDKKWFVYAWGWSEYKDIFWPNSKTHLTEFCVHFDFTDPVQYVEGHPTIIVPPCKVHNCTDEDCKDYREKTQNLPVTQ